MTKSTIRQKMEMYSNVVTATRYFMININWNVKRAYRFVTMPKTVSIITFNEYSHKSSAWQAKHKA